MPERTVPKARRRQLAKSEILLALAVKAEVWRMQVTDDSPDTLPFAQWHPDDPFRKLCKAYNLSPADLSHVLRDIGESLEKQAMRAGYEKAWVGVNEPYDWDYTLWS